MFLRHQIPIRLIHLRSLQFIALQAQLRTDLLTLVSKQVVRSVLDLVLLTARTGSMRTQRILGAAMEVPPPA